MVCTMTVTSILSEIAELSCKGECLSTLNCDQISGTHLQTAGATSLTKESFFVPVAELITSRMGVLSFAKPRTLLVFTW